MLLDEAFEKKDEISDAVQEQLQKNMATYGFTIYKVSLNDVRQRRHAKPTILPHHLHVLST
eukprot:3857295-Amphidinium_carterae.1